MRWSTIFLLLLISMIGSAANAVTNLPLSCIQAVAAGSVCPSTSYVHRPGKAGSYIATPSGVWTLWENLKTTDLVRACPADIAVGSLTCPVNRINLTKDKVAADPDTRVAIVKWGAPTTSTDGKLLPASEIAGYQIEWHPKIGGAPTYVPVGNVTEFRLTVPNAEICVKLMTVGRGANSDWTPDYCAIPATAEVTTPGAPNNVSITFEPQT